jgi:ABC-type transporter Mla MlaB component
LLSLELLQFANNHDAFDERSIEYAIAFEQSPPAWEPPPMPEAVTPAGEAPPADAPSDDKLRVVEDGDAESLMFSGVLAGSTNAQLASMAEFAQRKAIVPIDMTAVDRIDFVCAGSLLNAINRIEHQRKAVQIIGASPIIRALLLLIGISPRHFLKRAT